MPDNAMITPPSPLEAPNQIKRSVFRNLMISMIGFGILVGLVFPPFARFVLDSPRALTIQFFILCIFAGFLVGLVNYFIFRKIVSYEIDRIVKNVNKVIETIQGPDSQENIQTLQLPITSSDAIGKIQNAFNQLICVVTNRTMALKSSMHVSLRLSSITDIQTLLNAVVEEVYSAFHFYHVQIYLFDETREKLVMKGGTGKAGRMMLERNHSIQKGVGLVGQAAFDNKIVLVTDTAVDPYWLPNPLLPETKSEAAIPIVVANKIMGVLDVQQNSQNGISPGDVDLLHSIANQVGIAVQNAQLYKQAQHQANREAIINTINQRIQSAMTIDNALQIATREISQSMGAKQAMIKITTRTE